MASSNFDARSHSVVVTALSQILTDCAGLLPNIQSVLYNGYINKNFNYQMIQLILILLYLMKWRQPPIVGNLFLQNDSSINTDRILIFSTTNLLKLMTHFNNWFCDGTFSSTPSLFYQVYTIHAVQYSNFLPSFYILLPDKNKKLIDVFQALKTISPGLSPKTMGEVRRLPPTWAENLLKTTKMVLSPPFMVYSLNKLVLVLYFKAKYI